MIAAVLVVVMADSLEVEMKTVTCSPHPQAPHLCLIANQCNSSLIHCHCCNDCDCVVHHDNHVPHIDQPRDSTVDRVHYLESYCVDQQQLHNERVPAGAVASLDDADAVAVDNALLCFGFDVAAVLLNRHRCCYLYYLQYRNSHLILLVPIYTASLSSNPMNSEMRSEHVRREDMNVNCMKGKLWL